MRFFFAIRLVLVAALLFAGMPMTMRVAMANSDMPCHHHSDTKKSDAPIMAACSMVCCIAVLPARVLMFAPDVHVVPVIAAMAAFASVDARLPFDPPKASALIV